MELFLLLPVDGRRNFGYATHVLALPGGAAVLGSLTPIDPNSKAVPIHCVLAHDARPHPRRSALIGAERSTHCPIRKSHFACVFTRIFGAGALGWRPLPTKTNCSISHQLFPLTPGVTHVISSRYVEADHVHYAMFRSMKVGGDPPPRSCSKKNIRPVQFPPRKRKKTVNVKFCEGILLI